MIPRRYASRAVVAVVVATVCILVGPAASSCVNRSSCSEQGDCINTVCSCDAGYEGNTCADRVTNNYASMKSLGQTGILLTLIYVLSTIFRYLRAELLGGIIAGFLLGPVADWVAYEDAWFTVGMIGLSLLVMEGGLGIDVKNFLKTWKLTTNLAITGTILPCLLGWGMMSAFGYGSLEGFSAGTALSSTSIGMSLMMLMQFDYLKTPLGGIIAVAAMVDDVASLVILAVIGELQNASDSTTTGDWVWLVAKPVLISLGIIAAGALLTLVVPIVYTHLEHRLRQYYRSKHRARAANGEDGTVLVPAPARVGVVDETGGVASSDPVEIAVQADLDVYIMTGLILTTFAMVMGAGYAGSSYLLGAFASGMAFSQLRYPHNPDESRAELLWGNHASLGWWLPSVSFATLGFSIPASDLMDAGGFGLGMLYVIPAVLGKFCLGSFVPSKDGKWWSGGGFYGNFDDALVVGVAMVARGELGFVMSQQSFQAGILGAKPYVACIWALFVCTLCPPFVFGWALQRKKNKDALVADAAASTQDAKSESADANQSEKNAEDFAAPTATDTYSNDVNMNMTMTVTEV
eukprot:m.1227735 g.1227735  ORF g.1227735 m.1227735 type:complete len:577 (+) comp24643_c1_seq21:175-1905(+)